jgi:nucleoside-diphosphate kinase
MLMQTVERTLVIFKPEVTSKNLAGDILSWILRSGFRVAACKFRRITVGELQQHYAEHLSRPGLQKAMERYVAYMNSEPVFMFVLEGEDAINRFRQLAGATMPDKAQPGTIRFTYGSVVKEEDGNTFPYNVVHASDGQETAEVEINRFFRAEEIVSY